MRRSIIAKLAEHERETRFIKVRLPLFCIVAILLALLAYIYTTDSPTTHIYSIEAKIIAFSRRSAGRGEMFTAQLRNGNTIAFYNVGGISPLFRGQVCLEIMRTKQNEPAVISAKIKQEKSCNEF